MRKLSSHIAAPLTRRCASSRKRIQDAMMQRIQLFDYFGGARDVVTARSMKRNLHLGDVDANKRKRF